MKIPVDRIDIAEDKLLNHLLVRKDKNDKSGFLSKLGFTRSNWKELQVAIQQIVASNEAILQQQTEFGNLYEVRGRLKDSAVITIWLSETDNGRFRFVTLFPDRTEK